MKVEVWCRGASTRPAQKMLRSAKYLSYVLASVLRVEGSETHETVGRRGGGGLNN